MRSCIRALVGALVAMVVLPWAGEGQEAPRAAVPPADTLTVSVGDMVAAAVELNLRLRSERLARDVAQAELLRARAAFDPTWSLALGRSTTGTTVVGDRRYDSGTSSLAASLDGYLPTSTAYSLGASASNAFADPVQASVGAYPDNYATGLSLKLTQPLLRGSGPGAATALVRSARLYARAADEEAARSVEWTIAAVEQAFWQLRYAETAEDIASASLERARELYDRNLALRSRDLVTQLDVITAQRAVALKETAFLDAQRDRVDAVEALVFLAYGDRAAEEIASLGARIRTAGDVPEAPELGDYAAVEALALAGRRDLAAARDRVGGAEIRRDLARNRLRPGFDLNVGFDYGGVSDRFKPYAYRNEGNWRRSVLSFGAALSLPQFNRESRATFDRASLEAQGARLEALAAENDVRAEVRASVRGVRLGVESLQSSERVVRLAEEEYAIARRGLDLGQVTTFQLFQYEADLVSARLARARDEYQLAAALSAYYLAAGRVGERYGIPSSVGSTP